MVRFSKNAELAIKLGYTPVRRLDRFKPYILKIAKNNKFYILKTDHIDHESEILAILQKYSFSDSPIIIPRIYESGENYLVKDFLEGEKLELDTFFTHIDAIEGSIALLHQIFQSDQTFWKFTKDCFDNYTDKKIVKSNEWLLIKINHWLSADESDQKYRVSSTLLKPIINLLENVNSDTVVNFGAFSKENLRIVNGKIGIFDFGGHLRHAPKEYDRAYLWWGYFLDDYLSHDIDFWVNMLSEFSIGYLDKQTKLEFYACIIERLIGISKDLTAKNNSSHPGSENRKLQKIKNRRDEILRHVLSETEKR